MWVGHRKEARFAPGDRMYFTHGVFPLYRSLCLETDLGVSVHQFLLQSGTAQVSKKMLVNTFSKGLFFIGLELIFIHLRTYCREEAGTPLANI